MNLKISLPLIYTVFILVAVFWRAYTVWRKTGVNALRVYRFDGVHGFAGWLFRFVFVGFGLVIIVFSFAGNFYPYLAPITWLESPILDVIGVVLLLVSLIWVVVAQQQMGSSWRIGIDNTNKTSLVTEGIYQYSRNPIFLGIRLDFFALFIILPNAFTLTLLVLGDVLIQIQVLLEEEHLTNLHGATYQNYCRQVRRWL